MDLAVHNSEAEDDKINAKTKSDLREAYEARVQSIQNEIGDLETIRARLGLSARKICQLLLVDPSAWTRWKRGENPPPHVWQSLYWYIKSQDSKNQLVSVDKQLELQAPAASGVWLAPEQQPVDRDLHRKIQSFHDQTLGLHQKNEELESKVHNLEHAVRANRSTAILLGISTLILAFAFYKALRG